MNDGAAAAHPQERFEPDQHAGLGLWLVVLLPSIGLLLVLAYVIGAKLGFDGRATAALVAEGRGVEVVASVLALALWAAGMVISALVQNWPLALVGCTLAVLFWAIRYL